jgi:hypothetical protein
VGDENITLGRNAGQTSQGTNAVALGFYAGNINQGTQAVAIGYQAGQTNQGTNAISIGYRAGQGTQGSQAVAIGYLAGQTNQGQYSVAIGPLAGRTNQGDFALAIGSSAGETGQGINTVAVGRGAGSQNQTQYGIAIGTNAGSTSQASHSIAIGTSAGASIQDGFSIAIGYQTAQTNQASGAIAIGYQAGRGTQGTNAIAIGLTAGFTNQGSGAIAIGFQAGQTNQAVNSIVINASGTGFPVTQSSFYVAPIRAASQSNALGYDITNNEITYYTALQQVGLVKITSVQVAITGSFSAQNLSFANLFNSTYKNYRVILHPTTQVSFTAYPSYALQAFLGTGVPTTASLYGFEMLSNATTVVTPVYTSGATISSAPLIFAASSLTNKEVIFDIQNVGYTNTASQVVTLMCKSVYGNPGVSGASDRTITCSSLSGATITGLTIQQSSISSGNNFTLEAVVYGYNNL